jgi:hypothetical protein
VRGQTLRAVGIVGQRASAGGGDHRLWPRERTDLVVLAPPPSSTPTPPPGIGPTSSPKAARVVSIAQAIRSEGDTVTIEGTVTSPQGLFDADSRRVTVEDASAGVLLRLPSDAGPLQVGQRVRASGSVGRYFGAPQFEAKGAVLVAGSFHAGPVRLSRAPVPASLEWRLVQMSGQVSSVQRFGASWRAEIAAPGGGVALVQGTARSEIASTALVEGRAATVTGIVKRPHPSATDARLAIVPRSAADISLAPGNGRGASGGSSGAGRGSDGGGAGAGGGGDDPVAAASGDTDATPVDIDLADLEAHAGRLVRVGGLVVSVDGLVVHLEDGTAMAGARLPEDAASVVVSILPGEPINVVGRVLAAPDGSWEVVARTAADVARVGRLGELRPLVPDAAVQATPIDAIPAQSPAPSEGGAPVALAATGVGTLGGAALFGGLMAHRRLRSRRSERASAARVAERLERITGDASDPTMRHGASLAVPDVNAMHAMKRDHESITDIDADDPPRDVSAGPDETAPDGVDDDDGRRS